MTALAGFWQAGGAGSAPQPNLATQRMLSAQQRFGPDHVSVWSVGPIALGRCLYETLPEDRFDVGPIVSEVSGRVLIADIRLDNREELAHLLKLNRADLETMSDAAVAMRALDAWGRDGLDRLHGPYALALWDPQVSALLLARDISGHRPLFYHQNNGVVAIASMPSGLHALDIVPKEVDAGYMAHVMALSPMADGHYFWKGISRVLPGHAVCLKGEHTETWQHWKLPERIAAPSPAECVEQMRALLDQAVQRCLRGAGPVVAAHLSGGLDSNAVCTTAARLAGSQAQVVAFTSVPRADMKTPVPKGKIADESQLAKVTAAQYANIRHSTVQGSSRSILGDVTLGARLYDHAPRNPSNMVWMHAINDAAKKARAKVLLTGQVGNMTLTFSGSSLPSELILEGRFLTLLRRIFSTPGQKPHSVLLWALIPFLPDFVWRIIYQKRSGIGQPLKENTLLPEGLIDKVLEDRARFGGFSPNFKPLADGRATRMSVLGAVDLGTLLKGQLAHWGLDVRDPTFDRALLDYTMSLPTVCFWRGGDPRGLAREVLSDRVPAVILSEPAKGLQSADWYDSFLEEADAIEEELERLSQVPMASRVIDLDRTQAMFQALKRGELAANGQDVAQAYGLLRAVANGRFIRLASGSNQ